MGDDNTGYVISDGDEDRKQQHAHENDVEVLGEGYLAGNMNSKCGAGIHRCYKAAAG